MKETQIQTSALTRTEYAPYGDLIAADEASAFVSTNMGRAKRFDFLAEIANLKPDLSRLNVCVFRCSPLPSTPVQIELLEKHPNSTQAFIPTTSDARYLVIVCLGGDSPDLQTLKAFEARSGQSITYKPGVWHYPMTALERPIDFVCLIWEDGSDEDCVVQKLEQSIAVNV